MSKIKFLIAILILTFTISCGQQKRYVSYKVKKGETMRDIAKRLNMKTRDLLRINPNVKRRPSENTVIFIPNNKNFKTENSYKKEIEENTKNSSLNTTEVTKKLYEYKTHIVQPKETVYGLTRRYNITKKELIELNPEYPELKNNKLSIGNILKVGKIKREIPISLKDDLDNYITHKVNPKETVFSLTRFYNISKDDLVSLNPHLPELIYNKLNIGDILKIRLKDEKIDLNSNNNTIYEDNIDINKTIELAIMLPFKANEYNSVNSYKIFKGKNGILPNMVTDFYMGAEIAIDSLIKQGINVKTDVFDTGNRDKNISKILSNNNLNTKDVIIGPFYSKQVEMLANNVKTPVIFPHFSNHQDKFSSSKLIKTVPDIKTKINKLIEFLKSNYERETIFIVGDGKSASNLQINKIVKELKTHDPLSNINVLKSENGYIKRENFTDRMKPESNCWIIITSDDAITVSDVLNSMIALPKGINIRVFTADKNKAYDKIDNNKLGQIQFTYVTNTFVDNSDELTKIFNKKYKKKNNSLPSEYAIKGFDITYDILMRLASGNSLYKTFKQGASLRTANKFNYEKKTFGSTNNKGVFIVKYNKDLSLTRLE
ncbi:MAG: LysM peptidoglycan-binding domain-containing protein [Tenacibaculum sp.]|nr:LysM peptidoglycan-binding domain-containing protein [Tenacibaculum sp.]